MVSRKTLVLSCLGCLIAGWAYSQVEITVTPSNQRPVLRLFSRMAKAALWFAAFAEPPPAEQPGTHIRSSLVDENGYAHINHARGW